MNRIRSRAFAAAIVVVAVVSSGVLVLGNRPTAQAAIPTPSAIPSVRTSPNATTTPKPNPTATPSPTPALSPTATPSPTPAPTPAAVSDLTGLPADPGLAHRLPIAVMIDDNRIARPQGGFNGASIVYQALADGWETRYMLVYQSGESADIGPVRSCRTYFALWAAEYKAAISHYGGDRKCRSYVKWHTGETVWSVDGMAAGNAAYHRIRSRRAPHNAYTSTADLRRVAEKLGAPASIVPDVFVRPFTAPSDAASRPASQRIALRYRTGLVRYAYDPATNLYRRSLDGRDHVDPADGKRVTTTNVVVLYMPFRIDTQVEPGHSRPVVESIGEGVAWVFSGGRRVVGTWRKLDEAGPTRLFDADGHEIALVRGRTFFQIVPVGTKVSVGS